jgi:hypothetical protein
MARMKRPDDDAAAAADHLQLQKYESQFAYGKYGMCICTPVCYRLALLFVGQDAVTPENPLTVEAVHASMLWSARFYASSDFSRARRFMCIDDMLQLAPLDPQKFARMDLAGLIRDGPEYELDDRALCVMSLEAVLERIRFRPIIITDTALVALIVTFKLHTIVFFSTRSGRLLLFDPEPAVLMDVSSHGWTAEERDSSEPYSAVLICQKAATAAASP